jgi:hypothetical protein
LANALLKWLRPAYPTAIAASVTFPLAPAQHLGRPSQSRTAQKLRDRLPGLVAEDLAQIKRSATDEFAQLGQDGRVLKIGGE